MCKKDYLPNTSFVMEQNEGQFHFTSDSTMLGSFMEIRRKDHVLDIGCNSGVLLLYAAKSNPQSLTGVDIIPEAIEAAKHNLALNHVEAKLYAMPIQNFDEGTYEAIVCNPPYFEVPPESKQTSAVQSARHHSTLTLDDLFHSVKRLLKSNGRLYMVYRTSHLNALIDAAAKVKLQPSRMRFVYTAPSKASKTVLIEFRFRSRREVVVEPPYYQSGKD